MNGTGDKRPDDTSATDADAVFGDFSVPEDADVQTDGPDAEDSSDDTTDTAADEERDA